MSTSKSLDDVLQEYEILKTETHLESYPFVSLEARKLGEWRPLLKDYVLLEPGIRQIIIDEEHPGNKIIHLKKGTTVDSLPTELREKFRANNLEINIRDVLVGTNHLRYDEVISRLLPENVPSVSSFETIGHIAHLNLRDEHLPYRSFIGQVILDRCPQIRTVVNKTENIKNEFRVLPMEVIAGDDDTDVQMKEHGINFVFDYRTVYWNSRLQDEHTYLVEQCHDNEVVADLFAGIGPFAVPMACAHQSPSSAKARCFVYANDLNPSSYEYLKQNVRLNNVEDRVVCMNEDGRKAVHVVIEMIRQHISERDQTLGENPPDPEAGEKRMRVEPQPKRGRKPKPPPVPFNYFTIPSRFVMNLPDSAPEFLDAFVGCLSPLFLSTELKDNQTIINTITSQSFSSATSHLLVPPSSTYSPLPFVHCYYFTRARPEDRPAEFVERAANAFGGFRIDSQLASDTTHTLSDILSLREIRDVAPLKVMVCAMFRIPFQLAFKGVLEGT
ncbi:putative tRNA methyltransferase [Blattamonas nauphoetae]|uniref:tRNA (guanine(37)-N1)-methyltransferase n=1 Tax=Blattamonas nauphoetae TaxID=2049346 RepID=A0ABQ9XF95_9EUKA|nr:putative tRNA methyltransferase [Blattamonas nauphoetae]